MLLTFKYLKIFTCNIWIPVYATKKSTLQPIEDYSQVNVQESTGTTFIHMTIKSTLHVYSGTLVQKQWKNVCSY